MRPIQALLLLVLAGAAALAFLQLPELRRYMKIRNM
jgi:hypothetical protein